MSSPGAATEVFAVVRNANCTKKIAALGGRRPRETAAEPEPGRLRLLGQTAARNQDTGGFFSFVSQQIISFVEGTLVEISELCLSVLFVQWEES